ncbi:aminotransferase class V-fold PLP-dependent enzyme [Kineosporia babensis]|uniref:Aminotransferase class V-fold PLP-dependent enzyme n=1 Tax=Kineosporia babensis TaxID=499548 RepID=A0A9X1NBH0_9ACTN|nr:aminotransferase class V-fold PLP-dependent enzyme [Kineosporia babensis]MCD5310769.1 aminotransferase class V-fold PLP-dependent enzyme [Kineosporia babensis]
MDEYRAAFREPQGYLNFASFGPPSLAVQNAIGAAVSQAVLGGSSAVLHAADQRALAAIARLTGFPEQACTLATSTSAGLQQIAFGMPAGEVLVSGDEFPSNLYPWWRAQEAGLLSVRALERAEPECPLQVTPEVIAAALRPETVAVAISAVDFRTGYRADLAGLRQVIGDRLLVVDGIQGFGVLDQDWTHADALAVGGQKWLRAGWGTGFLALSPRGLDRIRPLLGSWTGVEEPSVYDGQEHAPLAGARSLSVTNLSPFSSAALGAALELLETVGVAAVQDRIEQSVKVLRAELQDLPLLSPEEPQQRAGILVVGVADAQQALAALAETGITATAHGHDRVRLSVHATTDPAVFPLVASILGR